MRRLAFAWLALALLGSTPPAAAQGPLDPPLVLALEPPGAPVKPLSGLGRLVLTVDAACPAVTDQPGAPTPLALVVAGPPWAVVTVNPATLLVPNASQCAPSGRSVQTADVFYSTTADAPAFRPADIVAKAEMRGPTGAVTAEARVPVAAAYFALVDVKVDEPIRRAKHGATETYVARVANYGNGPTRVTASVEQLTDGWTAVLPAPALVGARQTGTASATIDIPFGVTSPTGSRFSNAQGLLSLRFEAEYAGEDGASDERASVNVSVLLSARAFGVQGDEVRTPAPGAAAAAGLLALAALAAGGRARLRR